MMAVEKEELQIVKSLLPMIGIGTAVVVAIGLAGAAFTRRRVYAQDGQYLVSVRYPGQRHDLREFIQPDNPDVLAVYSQYGPAPWLLYDFVCRNINYRRDFGEFWMTPSETLRGYGDCEDTSILLTSLIRAGGAPNCYVALGSLGNNLGNYGHAWCQLDGQILETTFTSARPVPDPQDYCTYALFNDQEVVELWPGALGEVFALGRDEATKLNLMAEASELASVSNPDASWVVVGGLLGSCVIAGSILMAASIKR